MKRAVRLFVAALLSMQVSVAEAAGVRAIVRVNGGLNLIKLVCALVGCTVNYGLGDPAGQVFLVTSTNNLLPGSFTSALSVQLGVASVELDLKGNISGGNSYTVPDALYDKTPVNYFGTTVRRGYVNQPAAQIVGLSGVQAKFQTDGAGTVAIIDTGVDPTHPVLAPVLLAGYDFTRNRDAADERGDVSESTAAVVDGVGPAWVSESTAAVVDQSTAAVVDNPEYAAFGHGTMVAGIVHLVAPKAWILPLKAFGADGSGYTSDVIRAIYFAVNNNAKVLNMSFSFSSSSQELSRAISFANKNYVVAVAAAGNDGKKMAVYPAAYSDRVMGVASTTNADTRSSFSNYGQPQVWVAAPGEAIVTTYPWGSYAATWGTSFSTPFVAGAAALLLDVSPSATESNASQAIAHAKFISSDLANGRLDLVQAVAAWRQALGLK
jgi:subtilisin family serine protease